MKRHRRLPSDDVLKAFQVYCQVYLAPAIRVMRYRRMLKQRIRAYMDKNLHYDSDAGENIVNVVHTTVAPDDFVNTLLHGLVQTFPTQEDDRNLNLYAHRRARIFSASQEYTEDRATALTDLQITKSAGAINAHKMWYDTIVRR